MSKFIESMSPMLVINQTFFKKVKGQGHIIIPLESSCHDKHTTRMVYAKGVAFLTDTVALPARLYI